MDTTFRGQLERLKTGIRIAWLLNFLVLLFTYSAAILVFSPRNRIIQDYGLGTLIIGTLIVAALAAIITLIVIGIKSKNLLVESTGETQETITDGKLYDILEEISIAYGLKETPELKISYGTGILNAYSVADGQNHGTVVLTEEIVEALNREEMEAVIGHEVGHLVAGDTPAMTKLVAMTSIVSIIAGSLTNSFGWGVFGDGDRRSDSKDSDNNSGYIVSAVLFVLSLAFLLVAPMLAKLSESFMSRQRELQADALSVEATMNPTGLYKALQKIDGTEVSKKDRKTFNKRVGVLAFYASPRNLNGYATHPPISVRLDKLREMGADTD